MVTFIPQSSCPVCLTQGQKVETESLIYHVRDLALIKKESYFFCANPSCDVAYFSSSHHLTCQDLNKELGVKKSSSGEALLCYCFEVTKQAVNAQSLSYIQRHMASIGCRCDVRNPQGSCCLANIKRHLKEKE